MSDRKAINHVSFWPTPVDAADEAWRRQRLAGEEMGRRYRGGLAQSTAQREAVINMLIAELRACESDLWHERRSVQGLWASRRILVDEVRALREKLETSNASLEQQADRIAFLERQCARPPMSSGPAYEELLPPQPPPPSASATVDRACGPPPTSPRPVTTRGSDGDSSGAEAAELVALMESELASTRAELMGLLGRTSPRRAATPPRAPQPQPQPQPPPPPPPRPPPPQESALYLSERLSPLRWGTGLPVQHTPNTDRQTQ